MESFFHSLKAELLHRREIGSDGELIAVLAGRPAAFPRAAIARFAEPVNKLRHSPMRSYCRSPRRERPRREMISWAGHPTHDRRSPSSMITTKV
jgi:hypothetical protein